MRIKCTCGCGLVNYTFEDWIAHFKYGKKGKLHALKLLMNTKIEIMK